jgi:hypothetical protein
MNYNYQSNPGYTNSPAASQQYTYSNTSQQSGQSMNASVQSLAVNTANGVNYMLQNNYVRMFVFVVAAVYAGYTLMPVPKRLENMFNNSELFKYFVLFFVAASMMHPLDETKVKICLIVPIFVLLLFRMLRNHSSGKSLFHGIGFRRGSDSDSECSDSESRREYRRSKRSRDGSKKDKREKRGKGGKRGKKDKKSPTSDSVKGMVKTERFAII